MQRYLALPSLAKAKQACILSLCLMTLLVNIVIFVIIIMVTITIIISSSSASASYQMKTLQVGMVGYMGLLLYALYVDCAPLVAGQVLF